MYKVIFLANKVMVSLKMDHMHYYLDDNILKIWYKIVGDIWVKKEKYNESRTN